jgi:chitinase
MRSTSIPVLAMVTMALLACQDQQILNNGSSSSVGQSSSDTTMAQSSSSLSSMAESSSSTALSSSSGYSILPSTAPALKRVVGYVPLYRDADAIVAAQYFSTVTHANISFVNPDDTTATFANFRKDGSWLATINALRPKQQSGLKLLASIGGGAVREWIGKMTKPHLREAYSDSLVQFALDEKLDGIDIDLEGSIVSDSGNYNAFARMLISKAHAKGLLVTAAVAGWQSGMYANDMIQKLDFVNLMAYDYTGPWSPRSVGPHSGYARALREMETFATKAGDPSKITWGVPFYAHHYWTESDGTRAGTSLSFAEVVEQYPQGLDQDSVGTRYTQEGIMFYDGRITMRTKTLKAREFGGIMIWELGQDAGGDLSLLKVIHEHAR